MLKVGVEFVILFGLSWCLYYKDTFRGPETIINGDKDIHHSSQHLQISIHDL